MGVSPRLLAVAATSLFGLGCQVPCNGDFDCVGRGFCNQSSGRCEQECFSDLDCRVPPACRDNPSACRPLGSRCSGQGRCLGPIGGRADGTTRSAPQASGPTTIDGFDDPPGTGRMFVARELSVAEPFLGVDLDGRCDDSGCNDNAIGRVARLVNPTLRRSVAAGQTLLLLELVGVDGALEEDDDSLTLKIYGARDADRPAFPANDFEPVGDRACCAFEIDPASLVSPPAQARARAPAKIERGRLRTLAPVPIELVFGIGAAPNPVLRFERVLIRGFIVDGVVEGLMGGVLTMASLQRVDNPYCRIFDVDCPPSERSGDDDTLLDFVLRAVAPQPDIDLDFDGIECLVDRDADGRIDLCCDGRGSGIDQCDPELACAEPGREIAAGPGSRPTDCVFSERIRDGFSSTLDFRTVPARVVGLGN